MKSSDKSSIFDPLKLRTKVALVPCLSRSWRQPRPRQFYDSHDSHVRRVTQKDSFKKSKDMIIHDAKKIENSEKQETTGKETTPSQSAGCGC